MLRHLWWFWQGLYPSPGALGEVLIVASWENSSSKVTDQCQYPAVTDTAGVALGFISGGADVWRKKTCLL